ncbi:unnamed protein product [Allacma fusca]|uniref:Uncharacterized protein n=1 Tax=Allacma fusca TaxID=39272 RepID=A0A8J2L0B1_9HEXA|nr:unnamed protein product [Allacma fusca]
MMKVHLYSPCELLPLDGLLTSVQNRVKNQCEKQYKTLFLDELWTFCPPQATSLIREKREPVTFILCLLVAAAASAGIGMGIYLSHEVNELEVSQIEIEKTLDDLENKVMQNSAHIRMLQDEIKKMSVEINKLIQDINLFREKIIEIQYLVSYISSRLLIGSGCQLDPTGTELELQFAVPKKTNLTVLEADPFTLLLKDKGQTCHLEYIGPKNALLSPQEDCIHAMDMTKEPSNGLFVTRSRKCVNHTLPQGQENLFRIERCRKSEPEDEKEFVQIKTHNNKFYVYCPGRVYTRGDKTVVKCPNKVFTLPLTHTFTIDDITYRGDILNLIYKEKNEPLLHEKIDWHLTPEDNWDELNKTFPILTEMDYHHWNAAHGNSTWNTVRDLGLGAGLTALVLLIWAIWIKFSKRSKKSIRPMKKSRREIVDSAESVKQTPAERLSYLLGAE